MLWLNNGGERMKKNEYLKLAGVLCRRIRLDIGMSVTEIARISGYSVGTISQFEHGENNNLYLYLLYRGLEMNHGEHTENAEDATAIESLD